MLDTTSYQEMHFYYMRTQDMRSDHNMSREPSQRRSYNGRTVSRALYQPGKFSI